MSFSFHFKFLFSFLSNYADDNTLYIFRYNMKKIKDNLRISFDTVHQWLFIFIYMVNGFLLYSQTCSNDHLYKTTTRLRWPMLSPPKQILIQLLLYKMTTCLTQPATTFLSPKWKKTLSKTTTKKLYLAKKWETNRQQ